MMACGLERHVQFHQAVKAKLTGPLPPTTSATRPNGYYTFPLYAQPDEATVLRDNAAAEALDAEDAAAKVEG